MRLNAAFWVGKLNQSLRRKIEWASHEGSYVASFRRFGDTSPHSRAWGHWITALNAEVIEAGETAGDWGKHCAEMAAFMDALLLALPDWVIPEERRQLSRWAAEYLKYVKAVA